MRMGHAIAVIIDTFNSMHEIHTHPFIIFHLPPLLKGILSSSKRLHPFQPPLSPHHPRLPLCIPPFPHTHYPKTPFKQNFKFSNWELRAHFINLRVIKRKFRNQIFSLESEFCTLSFSCIFFLILLFLLQFHVINLL